MDGMSLCVSEPVPGDNVRKKSLCSFIRHNKSRVGCLSATCDDDDIYLNKCNNKSPGCTLQIGKKSHSSTVTESDESTLACKSVVQSTKLDFEESTQLVLCCAMTESSRNSAAYAGSSAMRRKDERVKKSLNKAENKHESPVMFDIGVQVSEERFAVTEDSSSLSGSKTFNTSQQLESCKNNSLIMSEVNNCVKSKKLDPFDHSSQQYSNMESLTSISGDEKKVVFSRKASSNNGNANSTPEKSTLPGNAAIGGKCMPQGGICKPVKQRLLTQCHSADNLLPSSILSPCHSPQSTPEVPPRHKKRSMSHDMMFGARLRPSSVGCDLQLTEAKSKSKSGGKATDVQFSASTENLARQSLLAAQLLHLIPAHKARERNYLHGRIAANSLLGTVELERVLPSRSVQIFVGTWNMNGQAPPVELNDLLLPEDLEHVPDIMAFGTQESFPERFEWEVGIQETVGPSHVLLHSAVLGTLHLAVFVRRDLIWFCSVAEEASFSVRPGTAFRTKGAVAIAFMLFGTSFLFVTSHLTAHAEKVKERLSDVKKIVRSLDLPKNLPCRHKSKDVTQNFDCVFWCGDLNFRLSQPREEVLDWVKKEQFPLPAPHKMDLDQLTNSILQGAVFRGFEEGPITFKPTFKYDPGTQMFDSSQKQRTPSYTDRILFKCRHSPRRASSILGALPLTTPSGAPFLQCLKYSSVQSVCTSDHKPVWALFCSHIRPGIDTIPLAAGLFNRDVYIEGINRRAAAMDKREGASTVCSIQ